MRPRVWPRNFRVGKISRSFRRTRAADFALIPTHWDDAFLLIPNYPPEYKASGLARRFNDLRGEMNRLCQIARLAFCSTDRSAVPTPDNEGHARSTVIISTNPNNVQPGRASKLDPEKP